MLAAAVGAAGGSLAGYSFAELADAAPAQELPLAFVGFGAVFVTLLAALVGSLLRRELRS